MKLILGKPASKSPNRNSKREPDYSQKTAIENRIAGRNRIIYIPTGPDACLG